MFSRKKVRISVQREAIKYGRLFIWKQILPVEQKHVSLTSAELHSFGEPEKNSERSYILQPAMLQYRNRRPPQDKAGQP
jgi:hypothetical protein